MRWLSATATPRRHSEDVCVSGLRVYIGVYACAPWYVTGCVLEMARDGFSLSVESVRIYELRRACFASEKRKPPIDGSKTTTLVCPHLRALCVHVWMHAIGSARRPPRKATSTDCQRLALASAVG